MTLGSSPMGIGWMTGWYFGEPCWFQNLRRSYSSYYSKMFTIPITKLIRITLVKWWWTTRNSRRQTQCFRTLFGCFCTWSIWCCLLQPFYLRYFVVHFDQKSCCFCAYHISKPILLLCECLCTWLIMCCHMEPFQMRYIFCGSFWSIILLFFVCLPH